MGEILQRKLILMTLFLIVVVSIYYLIAFNISIKNPGNQVTLTSNNHKRALILDGLHELRPNNTFIQEAVNLLEKNGFQVYLLQGRKVTVESLLNMEHYDIIVLRLHSGISINGALYLFTGEPYNEENYLAWKLLGIVARGEVFYENKTFFALNANYLGKNIPNSLNGSIVILMGCDGAKDQKFVKNLLGRGVKAYIAWDGYVSIEYSDIVVIELLKNLIEYKLNPLNAVNKIMSELGPDPYYGAFLRCFTEGQA